MSDNDIIAAVAPDAVSLMDKAIAEIKRLRAENSTLTAERDEARRDAERWQDDALRLMKERNDALEERDMARREVCYASHLPPRECAEQRGWDCWDRKDFCDKL